MNVIPSNQKDPLFSLIKSMTKAEKRNFKLYANRTQSTSDLKFVQLFDIIDKSNEYNDVIILNKIKGLKKTQLANLKRHLYRQILSSLRLIYIQKNIDFEIREQIDYAWILYGKGLYMQSLKLLEKYQHIAKDNHLDILHLEILEFQKLIEERHITRSRGIENKMETLVEEAEKRSRILHNSCKLSNLKIEIHGSYIKYGHVKNQEDKKAVEQKFKKNLESIETEGLSFFEKVYLFQSYVWYYYILLDFPKCYMNARKWIDVFDENPYMKTEDPDLYMRGIHYELTTLYSMGSLEKFEKRLNAFQRFKEKYDTQLNNASKILYFLYFYTSKINLYYLKGNFKEGTKAIPYILKTLKKYHLHLDRHRILVFYYKIGYMYVGSQDYDKALDFLNKILDMRGQKLREDIQGYTRLLLLMVHYEMGNIELLPSLVTSVQRYLEKLTNLNRVQKETLQFFRNIIRLPLFEHKDEMKRFRGEIKILEDNAYAKRDFLYLDVPSWLDSKICNVSLSEIVKKKIHI